MIQMDHKPKLKILAHYLSQMAFTKELGTDDSELSKLMRDGESQSRNKRSC